MTQKTLIRALSTGRTGTKFLSGVFANQGYLSFHEGLYIGEPGEATIAYTNFLGDLWKRDPEKFFVLQSAFAGPYLRTVKQELGMEDAGEKQAAFRGIFGGRKSQVDVLVDCNNATTLTSLIIDRAIQEAGINVKNLMLFRNPIKTIHAIYKVEGKASYSTRPALFSAGAEGVLAAAQVWKNYYQFIYHLKERNPAQVYIPLELEKFSKNLTYTQGVFDELGLPFDAGKYGAYTNQSLQEPVRSWKYDTSRNSDLFRDPEFSFSEDEVTQIIAEINDVAALYGIDLDKSATAYFEFHNVEKKKLHFK